MARTSDIGLRRLPQPPMPTVIPSASWATTSSSESLLSVLTAALRCRCSRAALASGGRRPLLDEGVACLVPLAQQVELEREALLEAVGPLHVHGIDAVERLLGGPDHAG